MNGIHLKGLSWNHMYREVLSEILRCGIKSSPRGMETRELLGSTLTLGDARVNLLHSPARKLNWQFSVAEFLWILLGRNDVQSISYFNKQIGKFSDDGVFMHGAYGPKFVEQLPYVLKCLREDPSSRQAVITIWRERPGTTKDVPCTVAMQFFIRGERLHAVVTMRSNDAFLGLPYDLFNFTMLQNVVAAYLGITVGSYTHVVGSLHLYEQHFDRAREIIDERVPMASMSRSLSVPPQELGTWFSLLSTNWSLPAFGAGMGTDDLDEMLRTKISDPGWLNLLRLVASRTEGGMLRHLSSPWDELVSPC